MKSFNLFVKYHTTYSLRIKCDWYKTGIEDFDGKQVTVLQMKPTNFFISKFVNPIILRFKMDGSQILSTKGRVVPRQKYGNAWKDLDAEIFYNYLEGKTSTQK